MRYAIKRASNNGLSIAFESTKGAESFYLRLGFVRDPKISKIFGANISRVKEIERALGSAGRYTGKTIVPKPPGLLGKSYYNEVDKWDERLVAHKASLRERFGFDVEALKVGSKEWDDALAKFESTLKSYTKPINKTDDYVRNYKGLWDRGGKKNNVHKFYDKIDDIGNKEGGK